MNKFTFAAALAASLFLVGCKVVVKVPDGGSVTSASGDFDCASGEECSIDVTNFDFEETFTAVPEEGFEFIGWSTTGFCATSTAPCRLTTVGLDGVNDDLTELVTQFLESDSEEFFVEPLFSPFEATGITALLETNADIALAAYSDSIDTAMALQDAINAFAADPSQETLDAAKLAWLVAREPYGQTEVYRFRLSPIDSTNYADEDGPEGDINAWPLAEALIDYVIAADPDFGFDQVGATENSVGVNDGGEVDGTIETLNIIADTSITIDTDLISNTATAEDERDVIAGYHAIEFMLWGQDLNDMAMVTNGDDRDEAVKTQGASNLAAGGQRPLSDFTEDALGERRILYMQVVVEKLIADLESVRDGWLDGVEGTYRDQFTSFADTQEAIQRVTEILTGMGTLSEGELAGERMQIAYSSNSQEDEHSCFADNTHRDVVLNALGIANSFYGDYAGYDSDLDGVADETTRAVNGYGFDDYAADVNLESLDAVIAELDARLQVTEDNYNELDAAARNGSPFDVLIMDDNRNSDNPIFKTIISLNQQSSSIAELAELLAIEVQVVDDDASGCDTTNPDTDCG
ncbi:MAG: imelysin family protein [Pseudomonadota bacterium]